MDSTRRPCRDRLSALMMIEWGAAEEKIIGDVAMPNVSTIHPAPPRLASMMTYLFSSAKDRCNNNPQLLRGRVLLCDDDTTATATAMPKKRETLWSTDRRARRTTTLERLRLCCRDTRGQSTKKWAE